MLLSIAAAPPPIVENPFTAPVPEEECADMPEAIHAETMNWFASILMLVLVFVLCCVTGWMIPFYPMGRGVATTGLFLLYYGKVILRN